MEFFTLILVVIIIVLLGHILWKKSTKNYDYFEKQNLKFLKPIPFLGTNSFLFKGIRVQDKFVSDYQSYPNDKVIGTFDNLTPTFLIKDPDLVKQLAVRDFAYFQDHKIFFDSDSHEIFRSILLAMKGKRWRDMRSSLTPLFTGSRMRTMLHLINKCAQQMIDFVNEDYTKNGPTAYSTKALFSKYTNDVIATCAFGVECDSLKHPNNEIYLIGQELIAIQKPFVVVKILFMMAFPRLSKLLNLSFFGDNVRKRFCNLIIGTMDVRKKEGIVRPDMIQLLMKLREGQSLKLQEDEKNEIETESIFSGGDVKRSWTDDEIIAQPFLFFFAGFDTSSSVMNFGAYELAIHPEIQSKLIKEIDETNETLNGGPLTYEILQKMKYMDMVISEVLRKWPPLLAANRECVKNYSYEDDDGLKFTAEKGTLLLIPIYAFHRDPKYFPDPDKFDPERFSDENKSKINMNAYMPFGLGPRNCIGLRFALMEIKAMFFYLLLNFELKPSETTQIPLKLGRGLFSPVPEKEIELYFEPRKRID